MGKTFNIGETYPITENTSATILDKHDGLELYLLKINGLNKVPSRVVVCSSPSFDNNSFEWYHGHYYDSEIYGYKHPILEASNYFQERIKEYELEHSTRVDLSFEIRGKIDGIDCWDYYGRELSAPAILMTYKTKSGEIKTLYHENEDIFRSEAGYAPKLYLCDIYTMENGEKKPLEIKDWQNEIETIKSINIEGMEDSFINISCFQFVTQQGDVYYPKTSLLAKEIPVKNGTFENREFKISLKTLLGSNVDIDVQDDVYGSIDFAISGPIDFTKEGEEYYKDIINEEITINTNVKYAYGETNFSKYPEEKQLELFRKFKDFMYSQAGYCAEDKWDKLFVFPEEEASLKRKTLETLATAAQKGETAIKRTPQNIKFR